MSIHRTLPSLILILAFGILQPQEDRISLAFLGDVMLGRGVATAHAKPSSWQSAFEWILSDLQAADLALANLESPVTTSPLDCEVDRTPALSHCPIDLRARPESLAALVGSGVDLVSIANNHIQDSGMAGVIDTRSALHAAGLTPLGPDLSFTFHRLRGYRLAFLALSDSPNPINIDAVVQAIQQIRQPGTLVIVSAHWGAEYRTGPSQRQQAIAQVLADAGVALIWGHHPHVLQPIQWIHGEGQIHPTLVAYSLGNALFDQQTPPDTRRGALLLVKMDQAGVQSVNAFPFWIDAPGGRIVEANPGVADLIHRRLGDIVRINGDEYTPGWSKTR